MKSITITISPTGETKVEANGYQGHGCKDATRAIEKALGTTTSDERKPEYTQLPSKATAKAKQR